MASEHAQTFAQIEADLDAAHEEVRARNAEIEDLKTRNAQITTELYREREMQLDPKEVEALARIRAKAAALKSQ